MKEKPTRRERSQPIRHQRKQELILNDEKEPLSMSKVFTKDDRMLEFTSNGLLHLQLKDEKGNDIIDKSTYA